MNTDTITGRSAYQLANMADCDNPDALDSPGAQFLERVARDLAESIEYQGTDYDPDDTGDLVHEVADSAVPIYTHDLWQVFVDLAAYNEDPTDLGCDGSDMEQAAKVCLYIIAERLCFALIENMRANGTDDEEGGDDVDA